MKRWIGLSLLLVPLLVSATSFWDGSAALQRGDSTFESGLFAASNSFPQDTQIVIQNIDTGKTATVTITKRIEDQSDILVLVSPMAAAALGMQQGSLASVRVTVATPPSATNAAPAGEQAYSLDPDLNPGAAYGGATQAAAATTPAETPPEPSLESLPSAQAPSIVQTAAPLPVTTPEAPRPEQTPAEQQAAAQNPAASTATAAATSATPDTAAAVQQTEEAAILAEAASRAPQKQLFLPPREDEKFAYQKPVEAPQQGTTPEAQSATTATAMQPQITSVSDEPAAPPAPAQPSDLRLAEAAAPEQSVPQEIVSDGSAVPAPQESAVSVALAVPEPQPEEQMPPVQVPVQTEVTGPTPAPPEAPTAPKLALLNPEAPAPQQPAAQGAAQAAVTPAKPPEQGVAPSASASTVKVPTTTALPKIGKADIYYLQLGAYATEKVAQDLATSLVATYPALVLTPESTGSRVYKVVIGPLNKAESGTLLTWFRYRGFRDAFLKQE